MVEIGRRIKELRERAEVSQQRLAVLTFTISLSSIASTIFLNSTGVGP